MVIFAIEGVSGPAERFRVCKYQNQGDSNEMSRTVTIGIPACCHSLENISSIQELKHIQSSQNFVVSN